MWDNNEPLQPFTINPTLRQIALPRDTTEASATVFSTNLSLVSRPRTDWRFSARVRHYGYENDTPHGDIPEFINYDTSVKVSSTGGPEPFAHSRTNFDADATWSGLARVALTAGYSHNEGSYDFRIFESSGEDVLRFTADATGTQWLTFRAQYETADKKGDGLNEALLTQIGEQPALRHYDIANRSRNRFTGQVDVVPNDLWIFSLSAGIGQDEYDDSYFGLQESTSKVYSISADYKSPNGFGVGTSYNYERYEGLQRSRSSSPDATFNDPNRDWTTDSAERVHYFSIYAAPPRIGRNTETRLAYDISDARGDYLYTTVPGGPLPAAVTAARSVQQAPAVPPRREAPAERQAGGDIHLPLRAVPGLRFRVRPDRGERHRPAQLARPGLRLSPVHRERLHVWSALHLVVDADAR